MTNMSGEIFQPPDSLDDLDVTRWNPLTCYLCNEKYEEPCIFGCFHSFCSRCLRGRHVEGKMTCPLCGLSTQIKEGEDLPPSDKLLKFLVESTGNEKEKCANCDVEHEHMYFCNTCDQPLCLTCREDTHKAKMFAKHDIVVLSKRTKEIHRECAVHREPYILFSTERKSMLCINCFRDMKVESRSYCVDLETAYNQGCKKLDQSMMAIKDLQNSVRDAILLLKVLLEEIEQNADKEKSAVLELFDQMLEKITESKTSLLQEVDRQYESKEKTFKAELVTLSTLLPTLHTHLVTSAAFCSSANRFEFLDLAYVLMERLKSIIQLQHPLHPSQGSQIITEFKSMFAKCLEPLLFPPKPPPVIPSSSNINLTTTPINLTTASYISQRTDTFTTPPNSLQQRRHTAHNSLKYKLIDSKSHFAEHCSEYDTSHKELNSSTEKLKSQIQELQRDLTVRRCLAKVSVVSELDTMISSLQEKLQKHFIANEQKQILLEKHWEESVQKIASEQELYQAQLHDILRLKQETEQLKTILSRMKSFVVSIASVTERIAPKLGKTTKDSEHDTQMAELFEQINTMTPDSQHRVDAIRTAQEERETLTANRQNPLDEELIKTKGMLRSPSERNRRDSSKRNSKEIKELMVDITKTDLVCNDMDIMKPSSTESMANVSVDRIQPDLVDTSIEILEYEGHYDSNGSTSSEVFPVNSKTPKANSIDECDINKLKNLKNEQGDVLDEGSGTVNRSNEIVQKLECKGKKVKDTIPSITEIETKKLTKLKQLNNCELDMVEDCKDLNEHTVEDTNCSNSSNNTSECDKVESEEFILPKDFVASTVKGFETQCLQNSPEKADNQSVSKPQRLSRTKPLHGESKVSHDLENTSNDISDVNIKTTSSVISDHHISPTSVGKSRKEKRKKSKENRE